ncbi:P-loop containing nucleoside triphosphate hydrolase protein [Suillus bovinus]|uniref:P-loop containing nucleoside triphosphate hydrolase protein n=1 Tax=Suillus bovinus TaxID=48563 RepID=UPI001B87F096|nr:P-loop containing nucleoside triphosphate hydrolase protein [Suillus bovinus]KAG2154383.1 P-loop containing nucleoside triphosphate hydrolase protein [Suillus bovinus]
MSVPVPSVDSEAPTYSEDREGNHMAVDLDSSVESKPPVDRNMSDAVFLVVMGVSGTGKSTLGAALSKALRLPFIDGDDLHPQSNVDKMSRGEPLTDADRRPWLETIRRTAVSSVLSQLGGDHGSHAEPSAETALDQHNMFGRSDHPSSSVRDKGQKPGIIIACSALKRSYRSVLRGETLSEAEASKHSGKLPTCFVHMKGSREVLTDRMMKRQGHFMKAAMLDSQLKTLESPENEEGVVTVSIEWSTEDQVQEVVKALEDGEGQQHIASKH